LVAGFCCVLAFGVWLGPDLGPFGPIWVWVGMPLLPAVVLLELDMEVAGSGWWCSAGLLQHSGGGFTSLT
jgi:hypothetical protein